MFDVAEALSKQAFLQESDNFPSSFTFI